MATPWPLPPHERRLLIMFVTAALGAVTIRIGAWRYASWHDPWLTPRWTHYMMLWWQVNRTFGLVSLLLAIFGLMALWSSPELRRCSLWWYALAALFASLLFLPFAP